MLIRMGSIQGTSVCSDPSANNKSTLSFLKQSNPIPYPNDFFFAPLPMRGLTLRKWQEICPVVDLRNALALIQLGNTTQNRRKSQADFPSLADYLFSHKVSLEQPNDDPYPTKLSLKPPYPEYFTRNANSTLSALSILPI